MSKIEIETLTPIHVGNGNFLQNNMDFFVYKVEEDSFIGIIDPKKIYALVGQEHLDDWLYSIQRKENVKDFVRRYKKNADPENYSSRVITNFGEVKSSDTLKECIHNGCGVPYIPGSSIKGAIRTAILSALVKANGQIEVRRDKKGKFNSRQVESTFFGANPKSDVFRFLQVGDAYFEQGCEIAKRMINLNIRLEKNLVDDSKPQLVEAIRLGSVTTFQMKVDIDLYHCAKKRWPNRQTRESLDPLGSIPDEMRSLSALFGMINKHTKYLVNDEISYWEGKLEEYDGAEDFIESLRKVLDSAEKCKDGKECVLRIGYGSGWRFITGAWSESLDNFSDIVAASRPNNNVYQGYDFPKSRRMDPDGDILGFVKLSILSDK